MFKLESYITPWLMGYLDRYVKLRPDDLQLSLWGGDAVLYNLDLRLDVLEKAMQLPITFKSGHIHELRLHVPWTKLGSEPILITINTVECILKVRDTAYDDSSSSASSSSVTPSSKSHRRLKRQPTEELPPGYLQSILNRIVNNVTFIINNLILKFVEDDIVLSVNVKSAECYSCDIDWKRAFVDISPQELVLRKVINFSDLTVCLDKSSADGRIDNYQEPMLYRCFIMCRLHMTYDSVNAKMPTVTRLNVFCEKLDWLVTDTQLPMFIRLIELCLALYYGYLDFPAGSPAKEDQAQSSADRTQHSEGGAVGGEDMDGQGWAAWMWSMVPQILPEGEEDELFMSSAPARVPVLSLGFYVQQATVTFKLTEHVREASSKLGGRKLVFHPFLVLDTGGLAVEVLMQGVSFFNVQCGISKFTLTSEGPCICGYKDAKNSQSSVMFSGGKSSAGDLVYDSNSLFDAQSSENRGDQVRFILNSEDHLQNYSESYGMQRFGSFWMDYVSTLILPDTGHSSSQSSDVDVVESTLFHQENSTIRFLFGPSHCHISSSAVHRIHKFLCCAWNHHYEPYKNLRTREEKGERVQLTETQIKELEEFIPTISYHLTLLQPTVTVSAAHHPHCNIPSKTYSVHRSKNKKSVEGAQTGLNIPNICLSAARFDLQLLKPMYPGRLVRLVSNIVGPSSNLLHHCHSHTQIKVFSLQAGLKRAGQKGKSWQPVIILPPCSMAAYMRSLVLPDVWKSSYLPTWEHTYELLQVSVAASKASLVAVVQVVSSWTQPTLTSAHTEDTLLTDLFPDTDKERMNLPVLELSLSGMEIRSCHTPLVQAYTGSLSSFQILLYLPAPSVLLVSVEGIAGCLDPGLLQWFVYAPRPKLPHTPAADVPGAAVDVPLAEATSPLQVSGSHMSIRSSSSQTQPTTSRMFSHSQSHSRPRPQSAGGDGSVDKVGSADSTAADGLSKLLVNIFPLLRMMQVQSLWWEGATEEVVVVCLPAISVHSAAATPMAIIQDIPITAVDGSLLSEKLPWTLQLKQLTAFTLHADKKCHPLLEGMDVTSTVGATVQYYPLTSDNIHTIAMCVHLDITPPLLALTHAQVMLGWKLAEIVVLEGHDTNPPEHESSGIRYTEVSATGGSPDGVDVGTTDLSEDTSQEPLHHVVTSTATLDGHNVKLSLWLQCVLPRLIISVATTTDSEKQMKVMMEDLALSCDMQQVYLKLKSKLGSVCINNYIQRASGEWELDDEGPVILSTSKDLPRGLHVASNQNCNSDRQPASTLFPLREKFSGEKAHGFFSLTYTRALCKNVRKKMKKMNVDLTSIADKEDHQPAHGLFFHKFVSEVCVKMEPVDVVLHFPSIERVLSLINHNEHKGEAQTSRPNVDKRDVQAPAMDVQTSSVFAATHTTPLVYADVGTVRLFVPVSGPLVTHSQCEEQEIKSTLTHNLLLLQIDSFHIQPYANNPLPRYPVEREMFAHALQTEMLHQTGSCVEDRQYQLQMKALSLSSGRWDDILHVWRQKKTDGHLAPVNPGAQNPALEWNTYLGQGNKVQEIHLVPMAAAFDLCLVVAPPIVYDNPMEGQSKLVCGLTAELNILSDLDLHLSTQQLHLLSALMTHVGDLTSKVSASNIKHSTGVAQRWQLHQIVWAATLRHIVAACLEEKEEKGTGKPGRLYTHDNFAQLTHGMSGLRDEDGGECVAFSFIQPLVGDDLNEQAHSVDGVCVHPFMYVYIAQPHTVISCWPDKDKVELSCYDVLVKGAKSVLSFPVAEHRLMPDHADFDVYWVETRAGQPDAKTGIPPCLLTLHLTNLLSLPAGVEVKVERPVKVNLGRDTMQQVSAFIQHLSPTESPQHQSSPVSGVTPERTSPAHPRQASSRGSQTCEEDGQPSPGSAFNVLQAVEKVTMRTEQVVVSFEAVSKQCTAGIMASVGSISVDVDVQQRKLGNMMVAQGSMSWKDVLVKTVYNKGQHILAGPVTLDMDAALRWPHAGLMSVPQIVLSLQAGLVLVNLGQETALCLHTLADSLQPVPQSASSAPRQKYDTKPGSVAHQGLPQITVHSQSHDDLRAGPFKYIQNVSGSKEWPDALEIVFSAGEPELGIDSTMTWAYPEPRLITAINTLPVPFSSYLVVNADQVVTVPCQLQYWDDRVQDFVLYARFELSESESSTVRLPEVRPTNISSLAVSYMWRVVLGHAGQSTYTNPGTQVVGGGRGDGVVLATALAASVCLDSCCVPDLVPALQASVSLASIQLQFYNHLTYNGTGVPGKLGSFKMSEALPLDQQWAVFNMDNLVFLSSHIHGPHSRSAIEACYLLSHFLPFSLDNSNDAVIFSQLIICNNTQETLRFGQVGTDENVALQPGYMMPYSWRSYQTKQLLHLCLEHPTWRWCSPISVEKDGHTVRVVRARDQRYTLVVKTKHLNPMCRQVVVSGQLLVGSRLSLPLEVHVVRHECDNVADIQGPVSELEAGKMLPSYVVEHEDLAGVSVRLAGHHLPWSHTVHVGGEDMRDNQLLK
ncbi:hypothetical protein BaRGS_00038145, partial [Batillaria attramentaria]